MLCAGFVSFLVVPNGFCAGFIRFPAGFMSFF